MPITLSQESLKGRLKREQAGFRKREAVCLALQEMAQGDRVIELECDNSCRARHDDRNSELMQAI